MSTNVAALPRHQIVPPPGPAAGVSNSPLGRRLGAAGASTFRHPLAPARLSAPLEELLAGLNPYPTGKLMRHAFTELARLLDYLRLAEDNFRQDRLMLATSSVLKRVRGEAVALVGFIESLVPRAEEIGRPIREAFDSIGYAITHELNRVFNVELTGLEGETQPARVRGRLESVHGLLTNCFQQSLITLARIFVPEFDESHAFADLPTQREQSLALAQDLDNLVKFAQRARRKRDPFDLAVLTEHLRRFREGSLRYLRYSDRTSCERLIEQITASHKAGQAPPLLDDLCCFLETLLIQIRHRSVLAAVQNQVPVTEA
ncbi:MAG: hypothetical protein ACRD9R_19420 [Pyrinomonadaceae bacterium]